ncbi:MAG: hypothetical protein RBG13Loki_0475, partial [Promethearchaeota archaeon CR_4]
QRLVKRMEKKLQEGQGKVLPTGSPGKVGFCDLLKDRIKGSLDIIDPYFCVESINLIDSIVPNCDIKIIGGKKGPTGISPDLDNKLVTFRQKLKSLQYGFLDIKVTVHDRWIVTKDRAWFLGTSLNGIGEKRESHVIELTGSDYQSLRLSFEKWWQVCEQNSQVRQYDFIRKIEWN